MTCIAGWMFAIALYGAGVEQIGPFQEKIQCEAAAQRAMTLVTTTGLGGGLLAECFEVGGKTKELETFTFGSTPGREKSVCYQIDNEIVCDYD